MTRKSFSARIFCQDGHADGVKVLAKSRWSGRGLAIPRASFPEEVNRVELNAPGVYVLYGPSAGSDLPTVFVGSCDPVSRDLKQHYAQKDFWNWAVVFASKDNSLHQTHMRYFESRLMQLAQATQRANIVNLNEPQRPELCDAELVDMEMFLDHILSLCPLLGLYAFEKLEKA